MVKEFTEEKITSTYWIPKEDFMYWAESNSNMLDCVKSHLMHSIADLLIDKIPITSTDMYQQCNIEYKAECAVMTVKRYGELLKAERDLKALRNIINVK